MQIKQVIVTSIATLFSVAALAQSTQIPDDLFFKGTVDEAKAKAATEHSRVMIITSATYCGPCKELAAKVYPTVDFKRFRDENGLIMLYYSDLDKKDPDRIMKTYEVGAHPSFIFLESDGKELNRWVGGAATTAELRKSLDGILEKSNSFASRKAQVEKDPSYAYEYIKYLKQSYKRYEVETELYTLLKKGPLKDYFTGQWWSYYTNHGKYPYSGIIRYMVDYPKEVAAVIGQEKYDSFMQDRGIQLINVNIAGANKRYDKVKEALEFIDKHPQLETTVSQFFKKNLSLAEGTDGIALYNETLPWFKGANTASRKVLFQVSFSGLKSLERKAFETYLKTALEECLKYESDPKSRTDYEKMLASLS